MSQSHSRTYYDCRTVNKRVQVHQGGTRSGKTMGICEYLIEGAYKNRNASQSIVTILRKTSPSCKATVMRDFVDVLNSSAIYELEKHNRTENTYLLYNTLFEFLGLDQPQKVRGRKRNVLWLNEANEFSFEDFTQLILRTSDCAILDYNPSDTFHWIYDRVITRDDCQFFQTDYTDNPFLTDDVRKEIERLKYVDDNLWQVFGLGRRGQIKELIYSHFKPIDAFPEGGGETIYGLDFGFNNPTALVEVLWRDTVAYVQEWLYESHLTNSELIEKLKVYIPNRNNLIYADAAEPQRIEEIRLAGFNIEGADKSVMDGINSVKRTAIYLTRLSTNFWNEINTYKWRMVQDKVLDEPVKFRDHLCDALRYAIHTHSLVSPGEYLIIRK